MDFLQAKTALPILTKLGFRQYWQQVERELSNAGFSRPFAC